MNLQTTGKYIAEKRKEKNLTQSQLAEILLISEKTVSKWECGKGFPDTSLILPLCSALDITANELLSAKNLNDQEYKSLAEKHLIELKDKQQKADKALLLAEWFIGVLSVLVFLLFTMIAAYTDIESVKKILLLVLGVLILIPSLAMCLLIETKAGFYQCKKCNHKYIPSYKSVFLAMHMGRTRYLKCPKCGKKSWNKKVVDQD